MRGWGSTRIVGICALSTSPSSTASAPAGSARISMRRSATRGPPVPSSTTSSSPVRASATATGDTSCPACASRPPTATGPARAPALKRRSSACAPTSSSSTTRSGRPLTSPRRTVSRLPDLLPFHHRLPRADRRRPSVPRAADAIAQHGFQHRASPAAPRRSNPAAEFLGLDADATRRAVEAGRRVLRLAGVRPRGFVAPAYAYTGTRCASPSRPRFDWWAEPPRAIRAPGPLDPRPGPHARHLERRSKRVTSPWLVPRRRARCGRAAAARPPPRRPRPPAPRARRRGRAPARTPARPPRRHLRRPPL